MVKASNVPSAQPTTTEEWRAIPGYPYLVSSDGRVCRVLRPQVDQKGYLGLFLCRDGTVRRFKVAALTAEAFLGPRPDGMEINHRNGIKSDNRVENLEYVSKRENTEHAIRLGLWPMGTSHGMVKLTEKDVLEIRRRRAAGEKPMEIAKSFPQVHRHTVSRVASGRGWRHLPLYPNGGSDVGH